MYFNSMFLFQSAVTGEWVLTQYLSLLLKHSSPGLAVSLTLYSFNMSASVSSVKSGSWLRSLAVLNNYDTEKKVDSYWVLTLRN